MAVSRLALAASVEDSSRLSDEVELYQRTYTTLLRSSGETQLRVLESSHRATGSSLHPLAASEEIDLGAFIYCVRRLPEGIVGARLVLMGQNVEVFTDHGIEVTDWEEGEALARRRRWYDSGTGTLAVLLASTSDVDDLLPTLVAFQLEWNKIRVRARAAGWPRRRRPDSRGLRRAASAARRMTGRACARRGARRSSSGWSWSPRSVWRCGSGCSAGAMSAMPA